MKQPRIRGWWDGKAKCAFANTGASHKLPEVGNCWIVFPAKRRKKAKK